VVHMKNKICSWTQTYGNERSLIFEWKEKDHTQFKFLNQLDNCILSFHNSSDEFKNKIISKNLYKEYIAFDGIPYPPTLYHSLHKMKHDGYNKILFLQDDVFSSNIDYSDYEEILHWMKNNEFNMINLEDPYNHGFDDIEFHKKFDSECIKLNNKIYKTSISDKQKMHPGGYSMDDGVYCADIDYLLNFIYDDIYFSFNDIWHGEVYLNFKHNNSNNDRYTIERSLFRRCNFVGRNDHNKTNEIEWLNGRFGKNV